MVSSEIIHMCRVLGTLFLAVLNIFLFFLRGWHSCGFVVCAHLYACAFFSPNLFKELDIESETNTSIVKQGGGGVAL